MLDNLLTDTTRQKCRLAMA